MIPEKLRPLLKLSNEFFDEIANNGSNLDQLLKECCTKFNRPELRKARIFVLMAFEQSTKIPAIYAFMNDDSFDKISTLIDFFLTEESLSDNEKVRLLKSALHGEEALAGAIRIQAKNVTLNCMKKIIQSNLPHRLKGRLLFSLSKKENEQRYQPSFYRWFQQSHAPIILLYTEEILGADSEHLNDPIKELLLTAKFNGETALEHGIRKGADELVLNVANLILNAPNLGVDVKLKIVAALDKLPQILLDQQNENLFVLWKHVQQRREQLHEQSKSINNAVAVPGISTNATEEKFDLSQEKLFNWAMSFFVLIYQKDEMIPDFKQFSNVFFLNGSPLSFKAFCGIDGNRMEEFLDFFYDGYNAFLKNAKKLPLDKKTAQKNIQVIMEVIEEIQFILSDYKNSINYDRFYNRFTMVYEFYREILKKPANPPNELKEINSVIFNYSCISHEANFLRNMKIHINDRDEKESFESFMQQTATMDYLCKLHGLVYSAYQMNKKRGINYLNTEQFCWATNAMEMILSKDETIKVEEQSNFFVLLLKYLINPLLAQVEEIEKTLLKIEH